MPIFEYRCQGCGEKFEKLIRRQADADEMACPKCGATQLARELSTFAAHASTASIPEFRCPNGGVCPTPGACGL